MSTTNTSSESNMEALLSAILTRNESFLVVPQSRVEELLLAIYESGGAGGGGGESGVDSYARSELLKKVDKVSGYSLLSDTEISRLSSVTNYNDAEVRSLINGKVSKATGYTLISETELTRLSTVKNYDDAEVRGLISGKLDNTVTIAGLNVKDNPTATQLCTALSLTNYVLKETGKGLSTNDFTTDNVNTLSTVAKFVTDNSEAVSSISGKYEKPSGGIPKSDLSTGVQESLGKADTAIQSHQSLENYVKTDDPRLTDSRKASDVYDWAKAENKPTYTKSDVGLGNVDNKSSEAIRGEITSTNVTNALGYTPINLLQKGAANGIAELDANGQVLSSQLPSYVDDVIEVTSLANAPTKGDTGKIYVTLDDNKTYRWSGSAYVEISKSLVLGTGAGDAFRGDYGNTAYTHSQTRSGNPHNVTKSDVGLGDVGNFKSVSTVANQGLSDPEKTAARVNIGAGTSSFDGSYNSLTNVPTTFPPATHSHSDYVPKTTTIAGVDLQNNVTKEEMVTAIGVDKKVDKTTVSSSISSSKCTIEVPEKSKAVSVCTMKGKTQKVVQIANVKSYVEVSGTTMTCVNGKVSITGTATANGGRLVEILGRVNLKKDHKYLFKVPEINTTSIEWNVSVGSVAQSEWRMSSNVLTSKIVTPTSDLNDSVIGYNVLKDNSYNTTGYIQLFDLTEMFGAGKEPTLAEFNRMFPSYVPYTEGTLWNAANESVVSVGKNVFDKHKIRDSYAKVKQISDGVSLTGTYYALYEFNCKANTTYSMSYTADNDNQVGVYTPTSTKIALWTGITGGTFNSGSNNVLHILLYASRGSEAKTTNYHNICLREGSDGTYVPYFKHTAEIPISLTSLADYGCSAGSVSNYIDFENGLYYHNVGFVDLGSLTWNWSSGSSRYYVNTKSEIKANSENIICPIYTTTSDATGKTTDKSIAIDNLSEIAVKDTSKGVNLKDEFKDAMKGVMLYYELADAKKEVIDISDIIRPLKVEAGGTVTFVNEHNIDCDTVVKYKKEV